MKNFLTLAVLFVLALPLAAEPSYKATFDLHYRNLNKDIYENIKKQEGGAEFLAKAGYVKVEKTDEEIASAAAKINNRYDLEDKSYRQIIKMAKGINLADGHKETFKAFKKYQKNIKKFRRAEINSLKEPVFVAPVQKRECPVKILDEGYLVLFLTCPVESAAYKTKDGKYDVLNPVITTADVALLGNSGQKNYSGKYEVNFMAKQQGYTILKLKFK